MEHGRIKGLALAYYASQLAIVDQVRHRSVAYCKLQQCFQEINKGFTSILKLTPRPAPPYFSFAAMKQQELTPNLMLILWLVAAPTAIMGAAIPESDAKSFVESEDPIG